MSPRIRTSLVIIAALLLIPASSHAQSPALTKDTVTSKADAPAAVDTIDKSLLTGFYEVGPGRGLTITLEKDTLYGAPSSGKKRKLIFQSGLAFLIDGTKMTLTFMLGADGRASDLILTQNGQPHLIHKTR